MAQSQGIAAFAGDGMMLVNGKPQDTLSLFDRGFAYGDGLFETIAVRNNKPLLLDLHWQRLKKGCSRLKIGFPETPLLMNDIEQLLLDADPTQRFRSVIKIVITRGVSGRGYHFESGMNVTRIAMLSDWPFYRGTESDTGIRCKICDTRLSLQPLLAGIKHLNRLEQVIARAEWSESNIMEGIMLDTNNHVIGGTMSNLFFVDQEQSIITPSLDYCGVAGVQRENILSIVDNAGYALKIAEVNLSDLREFSEVFISNSLIGIWPVIAINRYRYQIGPVTRILQDSLFQE